MTTNGTNGTGNLPNSAAALEHEWATNPRWDGVQRNYSAADVLKLRPTLLPESTVARYGAERLWNAMQDSDFVRTFGAVTGAQAVQMAKAGSAVNLRLRLAGRGGRQHRLAHLPRPVAVSRQQRAFAGQAAQQCADARRPGRPA